MAHIDDLWKKYKKTSDEKIRDELIKNYLPLVKYFADRVSSQLPSEVRSNDREDLYIEGVIGLMEALDKFDPGLNVKFETFASKRVRGAILDTLRRQDILPKNIREGIKKVEKAYIKVESELGRPATDDEISKELGMTKNEFYGILDKMKGITLLSLDADILNRDGDNFKFEDIIGEEATALINFEKEEAVQILSTFIEKLDKEERIILETYYWDEMTLKEIGMVLKISESRVCQIHTKLLIKLRSYFRKLEQER